MSEVVTPNEIVTPSKWDIIPIHTSDRANFKACRRRWAWSSPAYHNLIPKAAVHGIRAPLWFGTGIHAALEKFYDPTLKQDPVAVWLAWFDLQWNGGIITEKEVKEFIDRDPQKLHDGTYKVDGLRDILPNPDVIRMNSIDYHPEQIRELGEKMMEYYKEYAPTHDDFRVIAVEHDFSVPVLDTQGEALYMRDEREMPEDWEPTTVTNKYGPLVDVHASVPGHGYMKQVHARGRMDKIIQEIPDGRYGILDHKTTSRLDDDYFRHLDLDEQCTTYLWAGQQEAILHELEYDNLDFIIYEAINKAWPKPPTKLKSGMPSLDRSKESTTAEMFEQFVIDNGLKVIFDADPKMQGYYTWLLETGDKRFIHREYTWRNKIQRQNAGIRLYYEAVDMLSDPRLYPNPRKEYGCLNCIFRGPCIAVEDGSDWKHMIDNGYVQNWDR
jgi:hypothetical protein